jgi:hypothetical protein
VLIKLLVTGSMPTWYLRSWSIFVGRGPRQLMRGPLQLMRGPVQQEVHHQQQGEGVVLQEEDPMAPDMGPMVRDAWPSTTRGPPSAAGRSRQEGLTKAVTKYTHVHTHTCIGLCRRCMAQYNKRSTISSREIQTGRTGQDRHQVHTPTCWHAYIPTHAWACTHRPMLLISHK